MNEMGHAFRDWIAGQRPDAFEIGIVDDDHVALRAEGVAAEVIFYAFEGMPEVVEMHATEEESDESVFFLHFELEDLDRAKELFGEMADAITERAGGKKVTRVLLCCTVGMTTSMFAARLNEVAKTLSLDYVFEAKALEDARREGGTFAAVMLAPQVGFRQREVAEAFPQAVVFEIPAKIFGSYDATAALRMLMGLLGDESLATPDPSDLRVAREMKSDKTILIISVIRRPKLSTIAYRVYDRFKLLAADEVCKPHITARDFVDVLATLHLKGVQLKDIDAVGIALPGSVDYGRVTFHGMEFSGKNVEKLLADKFGITVFVDNNANAAAVGCYVSQDTYDSVVLHTQQVGYLVGGQGIVVNGHLVRGRAGKAGELGPLNERLFFEGGLHLEDHEPKDRSFRQIEGASDVPWRSDRMLPILATTLVATIAIVAPDAIYLSYDLIDDMDVLRAEIAKTVPEESMPDLIHIDDYHERIFLGETVLVLQRLHTSAT